MAQHTDLSGPMQSVDYSTIADAYARHRAVHPEVLASLASGLSSSRVLEVACGTGNYASALAASAGCDCTGIDPAPAMLDRLRERHPHIRALRGRAEQLELPDRSFDFVYSVDVIHHVLDHAASYREATHVLRLGGRVCTGHGLGVGHSEP